MTACLLSILFYGFWRFDFAVLMIISAAIDFFAGSQIEKAPAGARKKSWLTLSLVVNLGLLAVFKYFYFFADNAVAFAGLFGKVISVPDPGIILPAGISFYTFQTMSYSIDIYRGTLKPVRSFTEFFAFVSFFPQLVAGPIVRAADFLPSMQKAITLRWPPMDDVEAGIRRILFGLFLKVCLADAIAPLVDQGFAANPEILGGLDVLTLAFLFGFQIYFDFSGYSHIAIGSALFFGIRFQENFNFPYLARDVREFWQRWHISLSSWIRDYLYTPLKAKLQRPGLALFLTWAIMGLWHGAAWNFVIWGVFHATLISGHRFLYRLRSPSGESRGWAGISLTWGVTLVLVMLGWIPFRSGSVQQTLSLWSRLFDAGSYLKIGLRENSYLVAFLLLTLSVGCGLLPQTVFWRRLQDSLSGAFLRTAGLAVLMILVVASLRPMQQFIYFQF